MSSDAERFVSPIAEAVESANAETTEAGIIGALGSFETPIEIALRPGSVHFRVNSAVVSFLINNEPFRTGFDKGTILGGFHGTDLEGNAGDFVVESADAIGHVVGGDEFWMFPGDEENITEALSKKFTGFFEDFIDGESHTQNWVIAREAAVFAVVDALVGKVEWGKEANDLAEALLGELLRTLTKGGQKLRRRRREQASEISQGKIRLVKTALNFRNRSALRIFEINAR